MTGAAKAQMELTGRIPLVSAELNEELIESVYIDGGADLNIISERLMQSRGLKSYAMSPYKIQMADNTHVKCYGVVI